MAKRAFKVHDKVRWHYPEGKGCPSLEAGKRHIDAVMRFLHEHGLLSEEGEQSFAGGSVDDDYALTTDEVTPLGDELLARYYGKWIKGYDYGDPVPALDVLESGLRELQGGDGERPRTSAGPKPAAKPAKPKKPPAPPADKDITYDAVGYHWPAGKSAGCKSLADAKVPFRVLLRWLADRDLLSPAGRKAAEAGDVPDDFELTSRLLTEEGNHLLRANYDRWLRTVRYGMPKDQIKTRVLDAALAKVRGG